MSKNPIKTHPSPWPLTVRCDWRLDLDLARGLASAPASLTVWLASLAATPVVRFPKGCAK